MASQININEVAARFRRRVRGATEHNNVDRGRPADAAHFLFKGQCYDAKVYAQLLAGAPNFRAYIEAIERDQRIFAERQSVTESDLFGSSPLQLSIPSLDEDSVRQWFQELVTDGGDHA